MNCMRGLSTAPFKSHKSEPMGAAAESSAQWVSGFQHHSDSVCGACSAGAGGAAPTSDGISGDSASGERRKKSEGGSRQASLCPPSAEASCTTDGMVAGSASQESAAAEVHAAAAGCGMDHGTVMARVHVELVRLGSRISRVAVASEREHYANC